MLSAADQRYSSIATLKKSLKSVCVPGFARRITE